MEFLIHIFYFLIIIPSAIIHEVAHGYMAEWLGDSTARYAGRLTLDPRAHIDKFGTIIMPLSLLLLTGGNFMFAYAKPVPFNPYNLKYQKYGPGMVGAAGPIANLLLALFLTGFNAIIPLPYQTKLSAAVMALMDPLSATTLEGNPFFIKLFMLVSLIIIANIGLAVFNFVPIPPLDGSKVFFALLPDRFWQLRVFLEKHSLTILIFFIIFAQSVILKPILYIYGFFLHLY